MTQEGNQRLLTIGEIILAKSVYGNNIKYNRVWIHCDSYLPFGLQSKGVAMTPAGEIFYRAEDYFPDFSASPLRDQWRFIHEMMHVWQHQKGMNVRTRGLVSGFVSYQYELSKGKKITDFRLEQQASIMADYWLLKRHGKMAWDHSDYADINMRQLSEKELLNMYEETIVWFNHY
ncbi:type IV secretion protein Rhs [Enterobacteriaceae bacterium H11S18]|uniref:type IV secretion protein Rhs n=1 Tax=Dryocola clanedunensis TaxID=2925396 RepID=UPI0022EFE28E|nr:type IV secretion protein Rhs [Dryocola clanedunensis]MCT4712919.1 type IV secretion protein Rhs [Dryocola clanedunensis]